MLDRLTYQDFSPLLNQVFDLHASPELVMQVELISVTPLGAATPAGNQTRQAFSLVFRGPRQPVLPQRIYRLENTNLGEIEIFLVPIGPDSGGLCYEAIFN